MPTLAALDSVWDKTWPPYASMLVLELYEVDRHAPKSSGGNRKETIMGERRSNNRTAIGMSVLQEAKERAHAFRLLYQGRPLRLQGCDSGQASVSALDVA